MGVLIDKPSRCCAISRGPTRRTLYDSMMVRGVTSSMRQASMAMARCCCRAWGWAAPANPIRTGKAGHTVGNRFQRSGSRLARLVGFAVGAALEDLLEQGIRLHVRIR